MMWNYDYYRRGKHTIKLKRKLNDNVVVTSTFLAEMAQVFLKLSCLLVKKACQVKVSL